MWVPSQPPLLFSGLHLLRRHPSRHALPYTWQVHPTSVSGGGSDRARPLDGRPPSLPGASALLGVAALSVLRPRPSGEPSVSLPCEGDEPAHQCQSQGQSATLPAEEDKGRGRGSGGNNWVGHAVTGPLKGEASAPSLCHGAFAASADMCPVTPPRTSPACEEVSLDT